jgi:hemin uptake protein HemP
MTDEVPPRPEPKPVPVADGAAKPARRCISSAELLAGERMLVIRHGAQLYRLQLTGAGKLILTK